MRSRSVSVARAGRLPGRGVRTVLGAVTAVAAVTGALLTAPAAARSPITEYGPVPSSLPVGGVCEVEFDHDGNLWVEQYLSSQIARFDPATGEFANFDTPMPLSMPGGMDLDGAGNLWMPQVTGNSLLRVDTRDGSMTEIPLPWARAFDTALLGIPLHGGLGLANDIAWGPDHALWFTLGGLDSVGRYDPRTGEFSKYKVPGEILGQVHALFGIIKPGPGRTVVFGLPQMNEVGLIDVDSKKFTLYTMPTPASFPVGIRTAADGSVWVGESLGMKIARIDPVTGTITEYPLAGPAGILTGLLDGLGHGSAGNPLPSPGPVAQGSDGNIYVSVSFPAAAGLGYQIARFDPDTGDVAMWPTPSPASYPCDINPHEPGALWFGLLTPNRIGRLDISAT